jgi:L-arabinose isomerase
MAIVLRRREFLESVVAGGTACLGLPGLLAFGAEPAAPRLVSPGCRRSKVKVAKVYLGKPGAHWPTPKMDIHAEVQKYEGEFARMGKDLADVDFIFSDLVTSPEQVRALKDRLSSADGILVIHVSMGITPMLTEILALGRPTMLFAAPYSGHEWSGYGAIQKSKAGTLLDCMLTSDYDQLAVAIRPFRAVHHLREAKILNVTANPYPAERAKAVKEKFGTEITTVNRQRVLDAYGAVSEKDARAEADRWIGGAVRIVEPSKEEVVKSCRLALAFQRILDEEDATAITVECYGSMYRQLPAFPCISHVRMNNMGLAGICESDMESALTHILFQGLEGKPGFISDPTVDTSNGTIILAHCLGTTKMDGPNGEAAPYALRCIMERQEGAVPQVFMRKDQKVTQARLIGTQSLVWFTGTIVDTPDTDRGCRTKIAVKVDGDLDRLWQNWSHGLHRVTCYGDITRDLKRFCKFKAIEMVHEA